MKKKATVLLALISMCLIVTAGIGAVSTCTTIVGYLSSLPKDPIPFYIPANKLNFGTKQNKIKN